MRRSTLLMLFGALLFWGVAGASEEPSAVTANAPAAVGAACVSSLTLDPLEGAIFLLPPNCPVLCNLEHGKSCTGNPSTKPCYDKYQLICRTCICSANYTWNCLPPVQ